MAPRRVLVIEDDEDIRGTVSELLVDEGYVVSQAGDGLEGLERARESAPDVILLDLMMPRMDGWTFLEAQRADPKLSEVPVVIVSAYVEDQAGAFGAAAQLRKPFDVETLLEVVARCSSPDG